MYPATRAAAVAADSSKYFTGKPCKNGHTVYRYTQSGTCSECIGNASTHARQVLAGAIAAGVTIPDRAGKRTALADLVEVRLRAYPADAGQLRDVAAALCCGAFPTLTPTDVHVRAAPTDAAGGTALYRVRVPVQYVTLVRDMAQALLNARAINLAGFHAEQASRASLMVNADAPAAGEWRFA